MSSDYLVVRIGDSVHRLERCNYSDEADFTKAFVENLPYIAKELEGVLGLEIKEGIEGNIVVCGREVSLSAEGATVLSADALLLDTLDGTPIIVEAKLMSNRESRRNVLAQTLEYMVLAYLNSEALVNKCYDALEEERREEIIEKMKEKLEQRRIVGLIVSDELHEVVKQVIEVLNDDLKNFTLLGMELKKYCSDKENIEVIIPSLTLIPVKKRATISKKREVSIITREEFHAQCTEPARLLFTKLEQIAKDYSDNVKLEPKETSFSFKVRIGSKEVTLLTVYPNSVYIMKYNLTPEKGFKTEAIEKFAERIKKISQLAELYETRPQPGFSTEPTKISIDEINIFVEAIKDLVDSIKSKTTDSPTR